MRPLRLTLSGFHGIKSGLGRETLSLDLSALSGLVAITGPNGAGKTTVMDSLHPYRLMPFRAGGYSPRQFSFYEETYGEARKILDWQHGGAIYRSDLLIKGAAKTKKTECYLYVDTNGQLSPAVSKAGQPSDGKTETYDSLIEELLGAPEFFFTAIYAAQDRKRFADYAPGDVKTLLSDLLGLDHLLALSESAGGAAKHRSVEHEALRVRAGEHHQLVADLAAARVSLGQSQASADAAVKLRDAARIEAQAEAAALGEARALQAQADAISARREALAAELARASAAHGAALAGFQARSNALTKDSLWGEHARSVNAQEARIAQLGARLAGTEASLRNLPDAAAAGARVAQYESALSALDAEIAAADACVGTHASAPADLARLQVQSATHAATGRAARSTIADAKQRAALISEVPCAGMDLAKVCPLLANARRASESVAISEREFDEARNEYTRIQESIKNAEAAAAEHAAAAARLDALRRKRPTIETDLRQQRSVLAEAASGDALRRQLADIKTDLVAAAAERDLAAAALRTRTAEVDALGAALVTEKDAAALAYADLAQRLRGEIAKLQDAALLQCLADAEARHKAAQDRLSAADAAFAIAQANAANTAARALALSEQVEKTRNDADRCEELSDDVAQWRLLSKALGRDGIVALSIDDAGPSIAAIANDLLLACYGPRFSLKFETQSETRDGRLKETFDVRVFDAERNEDKSVSKTSGGERIWINEALTRAIALYRIQASGQRYGAMFTDESDGALDGERKRQFMRMKRQVLGVGGFDCEFFISHEPELWDLADHRIDMTQYRETA